MAKIKTIYLQFILWTVERTAINTMTLKKKTLLHLWGKKCSCSWSYFIFRTHKQRFKSVHRLGHHSLHAVVQRKAQQEDQTGIQQSAQDAAGQNRAVAFATSLRGRRRASGERLRQRGWSCCGCFYSLPLRGCWPECWARDSSAGWADSETAGRAPAGSNLPAGETSTKRVAVRKP